jgi:leucyl aminopeptidase
MPSVSLVSPTAAIKADAVIVGVRPGRRGAVLADGAQPVDKALRGRLADALKAVGATGRLDEVHRIPTLGLAAGFPLVVATGLGPDTGSAEAFRRAVGAAVRALGAAARVHIAIDAPVGAVAEGALLGAYAFTDHQSKPKKRNVRSVTIPAEPTARAEVRRAEVVAGAVSVVRDLVNTAPNDLSPAVFAERAAALAGELDLAVEVLDEEDLARDGYGGILGVGSGSTRPPRLVRISYRPDGAGAHVALVGKGITFDSGGLNLKTVHMGWMKSDMAGAAAVIASVLAAARLRLPVAVTATVPMAENLPSGSSYRPSDVLRMFGGRTVEVADTDAEGRLILADAITRAAQDDPDRLIEISTLTGAQIVALGMRTMGVMGEPDWRTEIVAAAEAAGENAWAMPLPDELRPMLDSTVADISNLPVDRWAGMLIGGRFLADFVPARLPWVHIDIAGPSFNTGAPHGYTPKGGTGVGVRTIVTALERLA